MAKTTIHKCGASVPAQCQRNKKTAHTISYFLCARITRGFVFHIGQNEEAECFIEKYLVVVSLVGKYLNVFLVRFL